MAADETANNENSVELHTHRRNYLAFIKLLKWGAIVAAIVAYVVMLIISD